MYSLSFPNMIKNNQVQLVRDVDATQSNLALAILSNKKSFIYDPDFGCTLGNMFFNQNNDLIPELVIDQIYSCIVTFMPQLQLTRNDITLEQHASGVDVKIKVKNVLTNEVSMYSIALLNPD